jgi:hypothetical protein
MKSPENVTCYFGKKWCWFYMFHIHALKYIILLNVTNQQMHIHKICFTIYYYLPTCFCHLCDLHQGATQEYEQYTNSLMSVLLFFTLN